MYNDIDRFKFLVRWPMIYACSLKAKEQSCSFVPEYILPQMIYQWIRTNATINKNGKIIGVIYNSSKLPSYSDQDLTYGYNFAGAIQHSSEKGYCALLRQVFKVSNPIELNIIEEKYKKLVDLVGVNSLKWIYEDNEKTDYSETVYSKIEHYFHQKKMYVI